MSAKRLSAEQRLDAALKYEGFSTNGLRRIRRAFSDLLRERADAAVRIAMTGERGTPQWCVAIRAAVLGRRK